MPQPVALVNVVGLTQSLLAHAPRISAWASAQHTAKLRPVLPAVTCSVQASMLTGKQPREHGIVANGWYFRDLAEIRFWNRSAHLIAQPTVWQAARQRDPSVTCANLFWWHNTYSDADIVLNVRPTYKADGQKLPDCYSQPAPLRDQLQQKLGQFPLFNFWGPAANITSSQWIARATQHIVEQHRPTLTLTYLPHLDYALQKLGPGHRDIPAAVAEIDMVVGELIDFLQAREVQPMVVSEYGIEQVDQPVMVNRALRKAGLLAIREELGLELLDAGASDAFAVADHQVAHVYIKDPSRITDVAAICASLPGIEHVLDRDAQHQWGIDHPRAGELVLIAAQGAWMSYDYWLDDARAPDFARTVDIHRKPGYDPRELFVDPAIRLPRLAIAWRLAKKKLGMRTLMDVIPLDASLVKGSHGRVTHDAAHQPLCIAPKGLADEDELDCTDIHDLLLRAMFGS